MMTQWREDERTGCWVWQGMVSDRGYGLVKIGGKHRKAHRVMWEMYNGAIPAGNETHHECENRRCINPGHLVVVSKAEHLRLHDGVSLKNLPGQNREKTHCKWGHPFDEANTSIRRGGYRVCRACNLRRVRAWHERHGAKKSRRPAGVEVELIV
jgi:hypothetical protein